MSGWILYLSFPFFALSAAMFFLHARFFCHLHTLHPRPVVFALPARCTASFSRYICPRSYHLCSNALCSCSLSFCCLSVGLSVCCTHLFTSTNIMLSRHLPSYSVCKSIIVYSYITMRSRNVNVEKRGFFKNKSASCREETERRKIGDSGG